MMYVVTLSGPDTKVVTVPDAKDATEAISKAYATLPAAIAEDYEVQNVNGPDTGEHLAATA